MFDLNGALERFAGKLALENILAAALALLACLLAVRLLLKLTRRLLRRTKLEERIQRYILMLVKLLLYTLTVVFTAGTLGINMTSLVALLSVGSLGVTLAAEDVLGNVAGGLVILSSHPFTIGDFIESGGVSALLPNKELAASKVVNYTVLGRRRIVWKMSAAYNAPTETVKSACIRAVEATEHILSDPAPSVYLTAFGESGIEFTVYCWASAEDFWTTQFALAENLRREFAQAGVEIPYQKLDVRLVEEPKK